ncbi:MAG: O-antigen ligase family protein, partial [Verrucomicrobia bacterium]|nr:O-antigen ligase family protein [Verrucomicrobiota bacterium]
MRNYQIGKILVAITAVLGIYFLSRTVGQVQPSTLAGIFIFFTALVISFVRGTDALYIIIFAMLFSPEIGTSMETGRTTGEGAGALSLRLEDILLIAVGCGWLLRTAYQKRHYGIMRTPVNPAIGCYIAASVIATMLGVIGGTVRLEAGIIHNLKFFEYFFLFFMILAHVREKKIVTNMFIAMLLVFFLALIYGYLQIELTGTQRVSAPFDPNEPNTFGGYIVLLMCVAFGIVLEDKRIRVCVPLIGLLLFAMPPLLFTLSRAAYMAFIAGWLAFLMVSKQRIIVGAIAIGLVAVLIIGVPMLPARVQHRITGTFRAEPEYHVKIAGIDLDASASARIASYQQAIRVWQKSPLFGHGVTGTHFIDGQYFRLLAETGIVGLAAFLFILWRVLREVWKIY